MSNSDSEYESGERSKTKTKKARKSSKRDNSEKDKDSSDDSSGDDDLYSSDSSSPTSSNEDDLRDSDKQNFPLKDKEELEKFLSRRERKIFKKHTTKRFQQGCIKAPNRYLKKSNKIYYNKMSRLAEKHRRMFPLLSTNNLCSFVESFHPFVKERFYKGHPLTSSEFNFFISRFFSRDIYERFLNENIEYRVISSNNFLYELSMLLYEKVPTIENVSQELENYQPQGQSRYNAISIFSDLRQIINKVPTCRWSREKKNKILYKKLKEYLSSSQADALHFMRGWNSKTEKYNYPDYYVLVRFLEEKEDDINNYLRWKYNQQRTKAW